MRAETFPAAAGWRWLRGGFALFRSNPGFLNFLCIGSWLIMMVINLVPLVGNVIGTLVLPAFFVGVLNGCRALDRKQGVSAALLFSGFAAPARRQVLQLGALYLLLTSLVFGASLLLAPDSLQAWLKAALSGATAPDMGEDGALSSMLVYLFVSLQANLVMTLPALVAAPLAASQRLGVGKALFFALVGLARNWAPALLFYGSVLLLLIGVPYAIAMVTSLLPQALRGLSSWLIVFSLLFVLMPVVCAGFYLALRDIFRHDDAR